MSREGLTRQILGILLNNSPLDPDWKHTKPYQFKVAQLYELLGSTFPDNLPNKDSIRPILERLVTKGFVVKNKRLKRYYINVEAKEQVFEKLGAVRSVMSVMPEEVHRPNRNITHIHSVSTDGKHNTFEKNITPLTGLIYRTLHDKTKQLQNQRELVRLDPLPTAPSRYSKQDQKPLIKISRLDVFYALDFASVKRLQRLLGKLGASYDNKMKWHRYELEIPRDRNQAPFILYLTLSEKKLRVRVRDFKGLDWMRMYRDALILVREEVRKLMEYEGIRVYGPEEILSDQLELEHYDPVSDSWFKMGARHDNKIPWAEDPRVLAWADKSLSPSDIGTNEPLEKESQLEGLVHGSLYKRLYLEERGAHDHELRSARSERQKQARALLELQTLQGQTIRVLDGLQAAQERLTGHVTQEQIRKVLEGAPVLKPQDKEDRWTRGVYA